MHLLHYDKSILFSQDIIEIENNNSDVIIIATTKLQRRSVQHKYTRHVDRPFISNHFEARVFFFSPVTPHKYRTISDYY